MNPYTIYKRTRTLTTYKKQGGKVVPNTSTSFYVVFRNPLTNRREGHYSVETLRQKMGEYSIDPITSKDECIRIVERSIKSNLTPLTPKRDNDEINFKDYLLKFWDYDNSDYIKLVNKLTPNSISRGTSHKNLQWIKNHVVESENNPRDPKTNKRIGYYIPSTLLISQLRREHFEELQRSILIDKGLSSKTWVNISCSLNVPLNELVRIGVLDSNPLSKVKKPSIRLTQTNTDTFTEEEVKQICLGSMELVNKKKFNKNVCLSILLGSSTGMRQGEVRSLRSSNIILYPNEKFCVIRVEEAFSRKDGFKCPKGKRERYTYCDYRLGEYLKDYSKKQGTDLIFPNRINKELPIGESTINLNFHNLLEELNIPTDTKKGHRSYHSLRHYCNTLLNRRVGEDITNIIIGHEGKSSMNTRYFHPTDEMILEFSNRCGSLIPEEIFERLELLN